MHVKDHMTLDLVGRAVGILDDREVGEGGLLEPEGFSSALEDAMQKTPIRSGILLASPRDGEAENMEAS